MPPKRLSPFIAKKIGNWDGAMMFFQEMGYRVKTVTLKAQEQICKDLKNRIVKHILAQDLNWEPLSAVTKARKNPANKENILLDTELYLKNIIAYREGNTWNVGIKKGIAYRRKGSFVSVDRVAVLLEFGTTRMPARPLWEPTMDELGGPKGIRNFVARAIYDKLKARSIGTPIQITKKQILNQVSTRR